MISILKANKQDAAPLSKLARITLLESHVNAAPDADMNTYVTEKYSTDILEMELEDKKNNYYLAFQDDHLAGFSNINLDTPYEGAAKTNLAKLDRIYILKEYYGSGIGRKLFDFNVQFAKDNKQSGIWLYTWVENHRAVKFYTKNGFVINGTYEFRVSANHSNPNHRMLLEFTEGL